MRGVKHHGALEQRVRFSRGHWRREEAAGAIRSAGWWESVTLTWAPSAAPERRPGLLHRALETIVPSVAEAVATSALRSLEHRAWVRAMLPSYRRVLPGTARALPRSDRPR